MAGEEGGAWLLPGMSRGEPVSVLDSLLAAQFRSFAQEPQPIRQVALKAACQHGTPTRDLADRQSSDGD